MNDDTILKNLRSSSFSSNPFLGKDENIRNLIEKDNETMQKFGITRIQITDLLNSVVSIYYAKGLSLPTVEKDGTVCVSYSQYEWLSTTVEKEGNVFKITGKSFCGYQECPFGCSNEQSSDSDITVETVAEKKFNFSPLNVHLIDKHCFFQGLSAFYRVDPQSVIDFFQMKPNTNYENWCQTAIQTVQRDPIHNYLKFYSGQAPGFC